MKYLTVGTKEIREDMFRQVEDTEHLQSMKPRGGLWLTEYNEDIKNYNHWVDFMMLHPNILFYKSKSGFPWNQPCSVVSLKDDVKIFSLDNVEKLNYLINCYPFGQQKFSYESLSKNYDGVFIDLGNLFHGNCDYDLMKKFSSFGVSSLVMFNLDGIDYYQSGNVMIDPFDYEGDPYCEKYYEINIDSSKKHVLKR